MSDSDIQHSLLITHHSSLIAPGKTLMSACYQEVLSCLRVELHFEYIKKTVVIKQARRKLYLRVDKKIPNENEKIINEFTCFDSFCPGNNSFPN
jgi:hypothetical protein